MTVFISFNVTVTHMSAWLFCSDCTVTIKLRSGDQHSSLGVTASLKARFTRPDQMSHWKYLASETAKTNEKM